ncbi:MAG TPA: ATP-binding protein [bacterium]
MPNRVRWFSSLRARIAALITFILVVGVGGTYWYIIEAQSRQFIETTKDQAAVLTHAIVKSIRHDMRGDCAKDVQGIFERIAVVEDIESLRIFDEDGKVTRSGDKREVGLTIDDIGLEIFKAGVPSMPYLGGHGYNAFCMVETIRNEPDCRGCHRTKGDVLAIFELCLSMKKTDEKVAKNSRFLASSAVAIIAVVGLSTSIIFATQVNRPISTLVAVMRRAEGGDLSARALSPRRDEIGSIGRSLNSMIERLDESQRAVERYHTEQLIRAERLASIGELAASVAHEIKNPLAGISGAVQVLADGFPPDDPRREVTGHILRQSERMDKTIRDLLNYAQPLQGEASPVDLNEVLDRACFIALPNPARTKVRVRREFAAGLPRTLADGKHLEQAFLNLILNAVQAMPEGGDLELRTSLREEAEGAGGVRQIEVVVADTGVGIPPQVRDKIFSPFFTTRTQGTGLGLSITRKIVEQGGGTISVASEPGKGTTFTVRIPVVETRLQA